MADKFSGKELELLSATFLLRGLSPELITHALSAPECTRERFTKGAAIYSPESFRRALGVLLSGSAQVSKESAGGGRLIVSTLERGAIFGAAALFGQVERYATRIEAERACEILFIPQQTVEWLMRRDFRAAENYIGYLSGRIRFLNGKIGGLIAGSAEKRLGQYICENAAPGPDGTLRLELTRSATELAKVLDIGRASLYRAFDALTENGAISREGKVITVLRPDRLL